MKRMISYKQSKQIQPVNLIDQNHRGQPTKRIPSQWTAKDCTMR